jgi:ATP-dependent Clp protease ATP-binding subunit ClpA
MIIGQKEAVSALCKALRRSRADLKDPRRPIGTFALLGPTGVGKTLLAKTLAEILFGDAKALIQLDMSEYMERHNASRMVGSPPGYVGFEEGGQLTEQVRRRPYSVVLFDEIEKAHPDVMNMLLQILEEGKLTDNVGRVVNFRNTIILLTSNVGAELIKRQTTMGFSPISDEHSYEKMKEKIMDEAKKVFRPEFMNRLDDIIVFRSLTKPDLLEILDLEVSKVLKRLKAKQLHLTLDPAAMDFWWKRVTIRLTARAPCAGRWSGIWKTRWRRKFSKAACCRTSDRGRGRRQAGLQAEGHRSAEGTVQLTVGSPGRYSRLGARSSRPPFSASRRKTFARARLLRHNLRVSQPP